MTHNFNKKTDIVMSDISWKLGLCGSGDEYLDDGVFYLVVFVDMVVYSCYYLSNCY